MDTGLRPFCVTGRSFWACSRLFPILEGENLARCNFLQILELETHTRKAECNAVQFMLCTVFMNSSWIRMTMIIFLSFTIPAVTACALQLHREGPLLSYRTLLHCAERVPGSGTRVPRCCCNLSVRPNLFFPQPEMNPDYSLPVL